MSYITASLSDGEELRSRFYLHWIAWLRFALWITLAPVTFGASLLLALYEGLSLYFLEQGLTSRRVIWKKGIIARSTDEISLDAVETVQIEQSVFGRLFGYASVHITGRGDYHMVFDKLGDPMAVKREIEQEAYNRGSSDE